MMGHKEKVLIHWFHRKAQPKMDHPSICLDSLTEDRDVQFCPLEAPVSFSPMDDLTLFLPDLCKPVALFKPSELAAMNEYLRRRFASGATYSDYSISYLCSLGELVEKLDMKEKPVSG